MMNVRILIVSLVLSAAGAAQDPLPGMDEASRLLDSKNYRAAAEKAESIANAHPGRFEPLFLAAQAWNRVRRFDRATDLLLRAQAFAPREPKVLFDLASSLYNQARWEEALHWFRELELVAAQDPNLATLWRVPYYRGYCAEKVSLNPEAIDCYHRALSVAQESAHRTEVQSALAGILLNSGRTADAIHHFERLVQQKPDSADMHYYLGHAYLQLGQMEKAEASLREARRRAPEEFRVLARLGDLYRRQDRLLDSLSFYQMALERNPQAYEPWYALSQIYVRQNDMDQADHASDEYARLYAQSTAIEEELRTLRRVAQANRSDVTSRVDVALLLLSHGRIPEAEEAFKQLLAVDPGHELALINMAQMLSRQNLFQDALYELEKVLERDPEHPVANFESARALMRLGRAREVYPYLERSLVRTRPEDSLERYLGAVGMLVQIDVQSGGVPKALDRLESAAGALAGHPDELFKVLEQYARLAARAGTPGRAFSACENGLTMLGKDHSQFKKLAEILVALAQQAGDESRMATYQQLLGG